MFINLNNLYECQLLTIALPSAPGTAARTGHVEVKEAMDTAAPIVEVAVVNAPPTACLRWNTEPHTFASRYIDDLLKVPPHVFFSLLCIAVKRLICWPKASLCRVAR